MKRNANFILLALGIAFLVFAIFGRYWVLPGYFESLESGSSFGGAIAEDVTIWQIVRYMVWAYSFKLGIFLITIAALLRTSMKTGRCWLYILAGLLYLSLAYVEMPGYHTLLFGIGGGIMTILIVWSLLFLAREYTVHQKTNEISSELKIIGYFFLAMATYNLCPLLGIKGFALQPEKMIEYGLQDAAVSFASHILIELVLGWLFVFLSHFTNSKRVIRWTKQAS